MDILIVKLGALGDVINTLPLAILLKEHLDARICWVTAPLSYPILNGHEAVDQTICFDRRRGISAIPSLLHQLRSQPFDLVLDLQRILKSGVICTLTMTGRRIGFDRRRCKELTWLLPFERITASDPNAHMVHQYLEFAHHLGIPSQPVEWRIRKGGDKPSGLPDTYVVLNVGATKPANRWSVEGFARLAQMVRRQHGMPCVLTGGPEDAPMAERIQSIANGGIHNLVGKTSLPELIDVIDAATAVVTCDTGPMHLATALGKRVIALFGPSDHRRTGPFRGKVIQANIACAPCNRKECSKPLCMEAIQPQHVLAILNTCMKNA